MSRTYGSLSNLFAHLDGINSILTKWNDPTALKNSYSKAELSKNAKKFRRDDSFYNYGFLFC